MPIKMPNKPNECENPWNKDEFGPILKNWMKLGIIDLIVLI